MERCAPLLPTAFAHFLEIRNSDTGEMAERSFGRRAESQDKKIMYVLRSAAPTSSLSLVNTQLAAGRVLPDPDSC